jgi:hypothetical protein
MEGTKNGGMVPGWVQDCVASVVGYYATECKISKGSAREGFPMTKLFRQHVLSETAARRFGWAAGFMGLASCTALVLKVLPEFGVAASIGLVTAIALAWTVVGSQLPKVVRAE